MANRCCLAASLARHLTFYAWMWVPPSFLWTWCHGWVGWGSKFFHVPPSARGIVCWTGWVSLALMSLTCPSPHTVTKRPGQH